MANKSLNKLQTGFSTAATDFGGSGMVGAIGYCYLVGMSGIWWNLTAAPAFLIVGFLFAKAFNRMDSATLPDYLGKRYSPAVKLLASVMHICSNVALLSSQFTIACAVLYTITGFSMTLCLIICLLLVICLTSGGLRSVVNTDAVLFVIIVTSLVVAVPIVLHAGGGLGSIAARLPDGFLRVTELGFWTPFSWFLLCFIGYSTNQNYVQRMAAAETEDTARFGAIFSGCFYLIISVILGIIGISAAVLMPGIEDSNAVFPELLLRFFPHGLIGLGVVSVFAATISTATSILHATTTLIVNDIWVPLRREKAAAWYGYPALWFGSWPCSSSASPWSPRISSTSYTFPVSFLRRLRLCTHGLRHEEFLCQCQRRSCQYACRPGGQPCLGVSAPVPPGGSGSTALQRGRHPDRRHRIDCRFQVRSLRVPEKTNHTQIKE